MPEISTPMTVVPIVINVLFDESGAALLFLLDCLICFLDWNNAEHIVPHAFQGFVFLVLQPWQIPK